MSKKLKIVFTVLEIIGGLGTMGAAGFTIADKYGELMELKKNKADIEAPMLEVKEA